MIVVSSITGAVFLILYFKKVTKNYINEGLLVGLIWLAINWILDFIILVPMAKMDVATYFTQIGLRYLTIPVFSITVGLLLNFKEINNNKKI